MLVIYQTVDGGILNSVHPHSSPDRARKAEKLGIHYRPRGAAHQCHDAESYFVVREYSK